MNADASRATRTENCYLENWIGPSITAISLLLIATARLRAWVRLNPIVIDPSSKVIRTVRCVEPPIAQCAEINKWRIRAQRGG